MLPVQILAVEILQHRFNIEKMVKITEILMTYSDEGETGDLRVHSQLKFHQWSKHIHDSGGLNVFFPLLHLLQTPIEALQEQCNITSATNSHVVLQLEHAQSLLHQFSEGFAEVSPWLEETQTLIGQLSLTTISYEAFREQQDLLQVKKPAFPYQSASFSLLSSPFLCWWTMKSFQTL